MNLSTHMRRSAVASSLAACFCFGAPDVSAQSASLSGTLSFKNKQTGRCLHNNLDKVVFTWPCDNANTYQDWIGRYDGDRGLEYKNRRTGYCLAMSGTQVTSATCNNAIAQRWLPISHAGGTAYALLNLGTFRCIYNASSSAIGSSLTPCGDTNPYLWAVVP